MIKDENERISITLDSNELNLLNYYSKELCISKSKFFKYLLSIYKDFHKKNDINLIKLQSIIYDYLKSLAGVENVYFSNNFCIFTTFDDSIKAFEYIYLLQYLTNSKDNDFSLIYDEILFNIVSK